MTVASARVPVVDYLVLDDGEPHLVGTRCASCDAMYLGRRNACAACGATDFVATPLVTTGRVESFTIVHRGAPKRIGPFISALVRLDDGAYVKANLIDVPAEPGSVDYERAVHLRTFSAGTDDDGTEAISFGFAYDGEAPS